MNEELVKVVSAFLEKCWRYPKNDPRRKCLQPFQNTLHPYTRTPFAVQTYKFCESLLSAQVKIEMQYCQHEVVWQLVGKWSFWLCIVRISAIKELLCGLLDNCCSCLIDTRKISTDLCFLKATIMEHELTILCYHFPAIRNALKFWRETVISKPVFELIVLVD